MPNIQTRIGPGVKAVIWHAFFFVCCLYTIPAFSLWRLCIVTRAALFTAGLHLTDTLYSTVLYNGVVFQRSHIHTLKHTQIVPMCWLAVSQGHSHKAVTVDDSSKIKGCGSCE